MEFLQAIEQAGPVRLLKVSFVAYPIVNALHIAAIGTLFGSVLLIDLSVLGAIRSVPRERLVALLRRVGLTAFVLALLAGLALFSVQPRQYIRNPAFLAKLGLIVAAAINFLAYTVLDWRNRAPTPPPALRVLAVISILLWSGVVLAGRFIGFV